MSSAEWIKIGLLGVVIGGILCAFVWAMMRSRGGAAAARKLADSYEQEQRRRAEAETRAAAAASHLAALRKIRDARQSSIGGANGNPVPSSHPLGTGKPTDKRGSPDDV